MLLIVWPGGGGFEVGLRLALSSASLVQRCLGWAEHSIVVVLDSSVACKVYFTGGVD